MHRVRATPFDKWTVLEMDQHVPYLETNVAWRQLVPWSHPNSQWDLGLSSWPNNKTWKHSVEDFVFTTTEENLPKLAIKVLFCVFFDTDGYVVPPHMTITTDAYTKILESLCRHMWSKCPSLLRSFILHHYNARSHTAKLMLEYSTTKTMKVLPYQPYSPDLALCDFWLFPKLKEQLRNWTFSTNENIFLACDQDQIFARIPVTDFAKIFQKWIDHWECYIEVDGHYFEKEVL